jgi:tape measure domain-containing protein
MAAASIIVDLLMRTSSFETDTQRAGRALSKLSKDAKSSSNQIASEFRRVQEAIQKAGMTASQQKLFDLKQLGASQQQLKAYARNLDELDRKTKTLASTNQTLATSFKGAIGAAGVGIAFTQISQAADSYTKLSAQLKNATNGSREFGQAYDNVQRIAASSQSDIEAIATVYARLGNATKDLGVSQNQLSDIVETLSLSLKLNGASSAEAASTLIQLSQAFGKGKLDGDEFKTAMEAAPNVMRALAKSIGVPFGALKDLASQGEITSEVMIKAFSDPKLLESNREQAKEVRTIGGGYAEIANQLKLIVGETNNATGSTSLYAKTLSGIASLLEKIRKGGGFDSGLANLIPGGQALSVFNQAGRLGGNNSQSRSGTITRAAPAVDSSQTFAELSKGLNLASIKIRELVKTQEEAVKSLNSGKISYDQYKEIISATGKELTDLTEKTKKKTKATKEDGTALKFFSDQQQELANLILKAQKVSGPEQTRAQQLQAELDAYDRIDPAVKDYIQSLINVAKAQEQIEDMMKFDEDQMEEIIKSEEERQKVIEDTAREYEELYRQITEQTEEANIDIIKSDKDRIAAQLSLENERRIAVINSMAIEAEERERLLGANDELYESLKKKNKDTSDEITEFWKEAAHNMQDAMSDFFFDAMQGNLNDLAGNFKKTIDRMVSDLLASQLSDFLFGGEFGKSGELGGVAGDIFGGLGSFFGDLLPSFDIGTPYVQQDMVAKIHKGERILTADENRKFSSGQMGGGGNVYMTIQTPNPDSFRKSQPQIMAEMQRGLNLGRRVV